MAKLRKMEWLALAGLALPPFSGADPAFKRRKRGSSPDTETPATGHGSGPSGRRRAPPRRQCGSNLAKGRSGFRRKDYFFVN